MRRTTLLGALAALAILPPTAHAGPGDGLMMCQMVKVRSAHGGFIMGNTNLAPIRRGRVPTLDPATNKTVYARFKSNSGKWVTTRNGKRYALAGQWISRRGRRDGNLIIAAPVTPKHRVLCTPRMGLRASAADTASYASDGTLPGGGYTETSLSARNVTDRLLDNVATRDVCSNQSVHPDGAARSATNPNPSPGLWCYSGRGAALNDPNGMERYSPALGGTYIDSPYHRHYVIYSGMTVPAAKRPSTYPDGRVIPNSPIVWRIVAKNATIAN